MAGRSGAQDRGRTLRNRRYKTTCGFAYVMIASRRGFLESGLDFKRAETSNRQSDDIAPEERDVCCCHPAPLDIFPPPPGCWSSAAAASKVNPKRIEKDSAPTCRFPPRPIFSAAKVQPPNRSRNCRSRTSAAKTAGPRPQPKKPKLHRTNPLKLEIRIRGRSRPASVCEFFRVRGTRRPPDGDRRDREKPRQFSGTPLPFDSEACRCRRPPSVWRRWWPISGPRANGGMAMVDARTHGRRFQFPAPISHA